MAVRSAGNEAMASLGSSEVYLEKYVSPVRHVEVQIVADQHGNVVSLGDRECSIQRRHQKLIEEAPALTLEGDLRGRLSELATRAARAIGLTTVGTVEFLLDSSGGAYFLEINARIQVEHTITEMVTGIDIASTQIITSAGTRLPLQQAEVNLTGSAIECRIMAEEVSKDEVRPSAGVVDGLVLPAGPGVRVDSALYDGAEISTNYDSLIAKVCAWGRDRQEAIARMRRALRELEVGGIATNLPVHLSILGNENFCAGVIDTDFIRRCDPVDWLASASDGVAHLFAAALLHSSGAKLTAGGGDSARSASDWRRAGRARSLRAGQLRRWGSPSA